MKLRCGSKITLLVFGYCFAGFACLSRAYATDSFQGLGDLPGGNFGSVAHGVSGDGSVVVGYSDSASGTQAFRWTQDSGMVGLGDLPGGPFYSQAYGVSADGSVVVGSGYSVLGGEAFRWTQDGGMVGLGDLPSGKFGSSASGVSADGSVVVGCGSIYMDGAGVEAFRWTQDGGMIGLGDLPGGFVGSVAKAVSADGSTVVGYGNTVVYDPYEVNRYQAFRWQNGTMIGLDFLPGYRLESTASAVSADGSVVVGVSGSTSIDCALCGGFRWENGWMTDRGKFGPYDMSADGSVMVGRGEFSRAAIWDAYHGVRKLKDVLVNDYRMDLQGFKDIWQVRGISDDGCTIVGNGPNANGYGEAWIATLDMGMITAVRGNATLDAIKAKMFDRIGRLSVLETGGDGYVRIRHPSGSEIDIAPNSKMQVDGSVSKTNLDLIYGRLKAKVKNHPGPCGIAVPAKGAMGVRGTELVVEATTDEMLTIVLEGEVDVSTPNGSQTITLGQNQGVIATAAGLGDPFLVDPSQIDRWWEWGDENTPPGKEVVVTDPETQTALLFDNVEEGGETTVTLTNIGEGPPPPGGLKIVPLGTYYEINTTAEFSGTIHIELEYDDTNLTEGEETALKLLQYDEGTGQWGDITTGLDMQNNIITGETVHLSFFALTTTVTYNLPPVADAGPDQTVEVESSEGTEVTLDGSASSDPDGDPLTYSWTWDGESATGANPTLVLPLGATTITLVVNDGMEDSEPDTVDITVGDTTPPEIDIKFPLADLALQDVVTLTAEADDLSGVSDVYFYVREPGGEDGIPIGYEELAATFNETIELWEFDCDTTELLDGYYVILAKAVDTQGNEGWSELVPVSIRNWAVIELLPASKRNKAGRTMPVKFSLRIAEAVDPAMPFVYNEELEIRIYDEAYPDNIMQISLYGDTSIDYRIDSDGELYITNFRTMKDPAEYIVEIWRISKDFLVGTFTFATFK